MKNLKFDVLELSGNAHLAVYPVSQDIEIQVANSVGDRTGTLHVGYYQVCNHRPDKTRFFCVAVYYVFARSVIKSITTCISREPNFIAIPKFQIM